MFDASLIISYYNRTDYLGFVFAGLEKQSFRNFEVIIADDGSDQENIRKIENMGINFPFKILHLWHEDIGFRKNRILNRAITAASSDYLIFIDGDCIPHPEFIYEHCSNKTDRTCLTGRRVNLSKKITDSLTEDKIKDGYPEKSLMAVFKDSIWGDTKDAEKGIYLKNPFLRNMLNKKNRGILGCNFSVSRNDMLEINGFDERYTSPSIGEDSDIQYRLELNGIRIRSLNNIAVQYHLYHKLQDRPRQNLVLFEEVKKAGKAYTEYGIF